MNGTWKRGGRGANTEQVKMNTIWVHEREVGKGGGTKQMHQRCQHVTSNTILPPPSMLQPPPPPSRPSQVKEELLDSPSLMQPPHPPPLLLSPSVFRSLPKEPQATCRLTVISSNGPGCLFCTAWKWISWR